MIRYIATFAAGFACAKLLTGSDQLNKIKTVVTEKAACIKKTGTRVAEVIKEECSKSSSENKQEKSTTEKDGPA